MTLELPKLEELNQADIDALVEVLASTQHELQRLLAENNSLLEALKSTSLFLEHCWCDVQMNDHSFDKLNQQIKIVNAAIRGWNRNDKDVYRSRCG